MGNAIPPKLYELPEPAYPRSVVERAAYVTIEEDRLSYFMTILDHERQNAECKASFVRIPATHDVLEIDGVTVFGNTANVRAVRERLTAKAEARDRPPYPDGIPSVREMQFASLLFDSVLPALKISNALSTDRLSFWLGSIMTVAAWAAICVGEANAQKLLKEAGEIIEGTDAADKMIREAIVRRGDPGDEVTS